MSTNLESRSRRSIVFQIMIIVASALWLMIIAASWADEAGAAERDGEYNFNWLDPDKKIYVLQNRRYIKANRLFASAMAGVGISNAYRQVLVVDPRLSYYFSEALGVEVFHAFLSNAENSTYSVLGKATSNVFPPMLEIKTQYGALLQWVPWYAKINVFNQILYFDWYFSAGAGSMRADKVTQTVAGGALSKISDEFFTVYLGTGHQYHITESISARIDFTGAIYQAPAAITEGSKTWFSNYTFGLGLGVRI